MVLDSEDATHLKPWLVRTLEPICDAEPGALADYILALLQHSVPENEMRDELALQLDEFLEKECPAFIDTLFTVIRTKSYLPYNAAPTSPKTLDNGIPIPLEILTPGPAPDRSRKRSSADDERDGRPPAKTQRLNHEGNFSRYGNGVGPQQSGGWSRQQADRFAGGAMAIPSFPMQMGGMGMNGMGMMNGRRPQGYQPPDQKRGFCRDYHNNGYCARGSTCKYSHGEDAVVPGQLYPGMPFMPMFPGAVNGMPFMSGGAYDPHEARMDMRPMGGRQHQRAPLLPRVQQEDGSRVVHPINASGELPVIQDLTPITPPDAPSAEPIPPGDVDMSQSSNSQIPPDNEPQMGNGYNPMLPGMNGNGYTGGIPMDMDGGIPHMGGGMRPPSNRGQYRGGRGGRGRGMFAGDAHNFRPEKRNDQTLVVEKIPEDKLTLESVNEWFKRFGTVTNVAIDRSSAKALVSFSNHDEAHAAWKSEEAVFNNRFVKVFWHRPMEGHGQAGARMLAASAPLMANILSKPTTTAPQPSATPATASTSTVPSTSTSATERKVPIPPAKSATLNALAEKQQKLETAIGEQKTLMASLSTASPTEKKEIMVKLRKLDEEMKKLTAPPATTTVASAPTSKKPTDGMTDHERKEHERLDKELEMRNENGVGEHEAESPEDLKAKLERLKAEAASLGLDSALPSSAAAGSYRGYRGRGRGAPRSYFRGATILRGGPPRGSMKLDNRPRKLLVKGVRDDSSQALKDWYETTGQLDSVEPAESSGTYIVSFKSRSAAEAGLAKGTNIPIVGTVQASWYTGKEGTSTSTTTTHSSKPSTTSGGLTTPGPSIDEAPRSPEAQEEEVASGWGNDDDEDGMGLL